MRGLILFSAVMFLSSCVSREEVLTSDRQTCATIGFAPETDQYRECVLTLQSSRLQGHHHYRY